MSILESLQNIFMFKPPVIEHKWTRGCDLSKGTGSDFPTSMNYRAMRTKAEKKLGMRDMTEYIINPEKVDHLAHPAVNHEQYWIYNPMTGQTARRYSKEAALKELDWQANRSNHPICFFQMSGYQVGEKRYKVTKKGVVGPSDNSLKLEEEIEALKEKITKLQYANQELSHKLSALS